MTIRLRQIAGRLGRVIRDLRRYQRALDARAAKLQIGRSPEVRPR